MIKAPLLALLLATSGVALLAPTAAAEPCVSRVLENTYCTAVALVDCAGYPKDAVLCSQPAIEECLSTCGDDVPGIAVGEVDLTWLTACTGSGHEERTTVGPVTIVTYVCDPDDV